MDYTRLTNLQVDGNLKVKGDVSFEDDVVLGGLDASDYTVSATDGSAAASTAPTKAEFDAVVTLANEIKAKLNALVAAITPADS